MAKVAFIEKNFKGESLDLIDQANTILQEYHAQGFTMTLRQLHYQFVARDLYHNTPQNYKRLGKIISDARMAGHVDWEMMEDRVRTFERISSWASPADIIDSAVASYAEDLWRGQKYRPEVWIEKDALVGVIEGVCAEYRVPHFACRGYPSVSATYEAAKRFAAYRKEQQFPIVFYLGDHDPSGIDMTRENKAKFDLMTGNGTVEVVRLALNFDQVQRYNPPPNFAKEGDSRSPDYIAQFGQDTWELDALDPPVIAGMIRGAIDGILDVREFERRKNAETKNKNILNKASLNWDEVRDMLERM